MHVNSFKQDFVWVVIWYLASRDNLNSPSSSKNTSSSSSSESENELHGESKVQVPKQISKQMILSQEDRRKNKKKIYTFRRSRKSQQATKEISFQCG